MNRQAWLALAVVSAAVVLRTTAIGYGLPLVFNADEPHHVNVAVSFGRGTLNPGIFKFPTLWMYALFAVYGAYFAAWSGLGLLHSVRQFGELFVWRPEGFYLLARLLSAAFSLAAIHRIYKTARLLGDSRFALYAAALLAVSPALVESSHAAKPDSLLLFFSAASWFFALRHHLSGGRNNLILCGFTMGLALSTQYTALPLAAIIPSAWWCAKRRDLNSLFLAIAAAFGGFFLGSPYILLDWRSFLRDIQDHASIDLRGHSTPAMLARQLLSFSGPALFGALCIFASAWPLSKRKSLALLLLIPIAASVPIFMGLATGVMARYLYPVYPALALAAAFGVQEISERIPRRLQAWTAVLIMLPGAARSAAMDGKLLLPDTRTLATEWTRNNIPPGTKIIGEVESGSPLLPLERAQVERLLDKTSKAGHPRAKYFQMMLSGHPGGGYEVTWASREPGEMDTNPWHLAWSNMGREMLDVRSGLRPALDRKISVAVLTSEGVKPDSPSLSRFNSDVIAKGTLLARFSPEPGARVGPDIRIYRIHP